MNKFETAIDCINDIKWDYEILLDENKDLKEKVEELEKRIVDLETENEHLKQDLAREEL